MTKTEELILSTERKIERRLDEHTQMQVMLESCKRDFDALYVWGNLEKYQQDAISHKVRDIEALLKKVNS